MLLVIDYLNMQCLLIKECKVPNFKKCYYWSYSQEISFILSITCYLSSFSVAIKSTTCWIIYEEKVYFGSWEAGECLSEWPHRVRASDDFHHDGKWEGQVRECWRQERSSHVANPFWQERLSACLSACLSMYLCVYLC